MEPTESIRTPLRFVREAVRLTILLAILCPGVASRAAQPSPFDTFDLPDDWETRFWASPNAVALLKMGPAEVADLVPAQAGIRYCRCSECDATETDDTLEWSVLKPDTLNCHACGATIEIRACLGHEKKDEETSDKDKDKEKEKKDEPAEKDKPSDDKKKPDSKTEDTVEVRSGVTHHYPYVEVAPDKQQYPGERLYLAARRDHEAREFLSKFALYAAVRHREQPAGQRDPALARLAATILVRFAQVYPSYSTHFDQPRSSKFFDKADLPAPYRSGYRSARWGWTASQGVPLNLVIAYALLRNDPAVIEASWLLDEPEPARRLERDLFRASASFVASQPDECNEATLQANRGLLAVGRLLNDPELVREALARRQRFAERAFYHDGFWRQGTLSAHQRVLGQLDASIEKQLLNGEPDPPIFALAHQAGSAVLSDASASDVQLASIPSSARPESPRTATLLGGTGIARLTVGKGADALDVELRGLDSTGPERIERQGLRLAIAGRTALGDLDDGPGLPSGFDRASVSHNTVVVDGLNQRESPSLAREPAVGGSFLFFAADPDFQVVTLDDPRAYPVSATRYRQTLIASAGARSRYALSVFEVRGGLQHDQLFHAPSGSAARWSLSVLTSPGPTTLLPPGLTLVPTAGLEQGRWFVQAFGAFNSLQHGPIDKPAMALLTTPGAPTSVRLHVLGNAPTTAITAVSPDRDSPAGEGRGSLVLRRRSRDGSTLNTTFVTLFEPISSSIPMLKRVGRLASASGAIVIYAETVDGPEYLVVNPSPGTLIRVPLTDGRVLSTDGLAVRVSGSGSSTRLVLAGGTIAECGGQIVRLEPYEGKVTQSVRLSSPGSPGWFQTDTPLPSPATLAGRVLLIRHGDGSTRGWTLDRVENTSNTARLFVREQPGFVVDPATGSAQYYQYPLITIPGPHAFRISRLGRAPAVVSEVRP